VIDNAIRKLNMDDKFQRIIKSEINEKVDTAVVSNNNLKFKNKDMMFQKSIDIPSIFY